MVLKVVQQTKLVIDVLEAEDAVLELILISQFIAFLTAARQDGVDKEDRNS